MSVPKIYTPQKAIPPIDSGTSGDNLVAAINDRFRRIQTPPGGAAVEPPAVVLPTWIEEIPAGLMNGANATFALSRAPIAGSLELELNIPQVRGTDYTIAGQNITYTVAPKARDTGYHKARYQYQ